MTPGAHAWDEIKGRTVTSKVSASCFVHPAEALFNSTPQLLACDRRAVAQGAELGRGDLRMDKLRDFYVGILGHQSQLLLSFASRVSLEYAIHLM